MRECLRNRMEALDKMDPINTRLKIIKVEKKYMQMELTQMKVKNQCHQNLLVWDCREETGL